MRCPSLKELPSPPSGKSGWPWTEESPQLPDTTPDGSKWPRLSIVTPSFNQGQYIEETIRSVLLQGYPNIEYIIIDGGSTDRSVNIIEKYAKWLAYWETKPDKGQSCAINKGFKRASGEITAWLNSDDTYCEKAFLNVATQFLSKKDSSLVCGDCAFVNSDGEIIKHAISRFNDKNIKKEIYFGNNFIFQPSTFIRKSVFDKIGHLDESLHFTMDLDLWLRILTDFSSSYIPTILSKFRIHDNSKTNKNELSFWFEKLVVGDRYSPELFCDIAARLLLLYAGDNNYDIEKSFQEIRINTKSNKSFQNVFDSLNRYRRDIISKAYIGKADISYYNLDLKMARKYLIYALRIYTSTIVSKHFIRLFLRTYLPKHLIRYLRK